MGASNDLPLRVCGSCFHCICYEEQEPWCVKFQHYVRPLLVACPSYVLDPFSLEYEEGYQDEQDK